jgi:hypothetical protein
MHEPGYYRQSLSAFVRANADTVALIDELHFAINDDWCPGPSLLSAIREEHEDFDRARLAVLLEPPEWPETFHGPTRRSMNRDRYSRSGTSGLASRLQQAQLLIEQNGGRVEW